MLRNSPLFDEAHGKGKALPQAGPQPYANPHHTRGSPQALQPPLPGLRDYQNTPQKRLLDLRERALSLPHQQPLYRSRVGSIHGSINRNAPLPSGPDQQGQVGGPEQGQIGALPASPS